MRSEERLQRIERRTELPLLALALVMIPLLLLPLTVDLSPGLERWFFVADWLIWAAFAADFGLKLLVAPHPLAYTRSHWLETAMVVLPFLRPLRATRLLRLARVAVVLGLNVGLVQSLFRQRGSSFIMACLLVAVVGGGTMAFLAERQSEGANITSLGDSIWWALVTMTTVGYGEHYPTTVLGRAVAILLMLFGIAALSVATASIAALLVRDQDQLELTDVVAKLERQEERFGAQLEAIRNQLAEIQASAQRR